MTALADRRHGSEPLDRQGQSGHPGHEPQLVAAVDLNETVAETDEQNNALTITVRCGGDE